MGSSHEVPGHRTDSWDPATKCGWLMPGSWDPATKCGWLMGVRRKSRVSESIYDGKVEPKGAQRLPSGRALIGFRRPWAEARFRGAAGEKLPPCAWRG